MNLEPQKTESEIQTHGGVTRIFAGITIFILALLAVLVVLEVIPRTALAEVATKTAMIVGICLLSVVAIGFLSKR